MTGGRGGSATIAAGRASRMLPAPFLIGTRSTRTWVGAAVLLPMLSSALLISSSDRSHEPALAVTSKQPGLSVTIEIGSSPMLIAFFPGVSGSASTTWKSDWPLIIFSDGCGVQVATATVPVEDCNRNAYHAGRGVAPATDPCPYTGVVAISGPVPSTSMVIALRRGVSGGDKS